MHPRSGGRWSAKLSGSTASSSTGPGTNNALPFVHTETSFSGDEDDFPARGNAVMKAASIQAGTARTLNLRVCVQGVFGDAAGEGLKVQARASNADAWADALTIPGWQYANYEAGDALTEWDGNPLPAGTVCAAAGGWIDVSALIPDDATQVRLRPNTVGDSGSSFQHDIALRQMSWTYLP